MVEGQLNTLYCPTSHQPRMVAGMLNPLYCPRCIANHLVSHALWHAAEPIVLPPVVLPMTASATWVAGTSTAYLVAGLGVDRVLLAVWHLLALEVHSRAAAEDVLLQIRQCLDDGLCLDRLAPIQVVHHCKPRPNTSFLFCPRHGHAPSWVAAYFRHRPILSQQM